MLIGFRTAKCPYCGYRFSYAVGGIIYDPDTAKCPTCGKTFDNSIISRIIRTVFTQKQK